MPKTPPHLPGSLTMEAILLAEFIYGKGKAGADERRRVVIEALDRLVGGFDEKGNNSRLGIDWKDG